MDPRTASLAAHSPERGLLFELLAYAAADVPVDYGNAISAQRLEESDANQVQWVIDAGLAPLLYRASRDGLQQVAPALRDMLLSADLTAIVRHGNLVEATRDIVDACAMRGVRVALLKGISIADQYYPAAHLRPMGDIDILAPEAACGTVESTMRQLGYEPESGHQRREGAHHGAPLFHPERRLWVEVHNALFSQDANLRSGRVFSPSNVAVHCVASTFHGSPVDRLDDELQLIYIASSWVRDLSQYGIHASFAPPLLDALYLLKATKHRLDWNRLLGCLDNPMATASLHVMLTYLCRHGLYEADPAVISRLSSGQDVIGPLVLRAIHRILDRYLVGGTPYSRWFSDWRVSIVLSTLLSPHASRAKLPSIPWNIVFPPSVAQRYSMKYQLDRIARLLRGRA